jgi:hypothetical protein
MAWALGVDIGQAQDPAALAAIEHVETEFHLRHVERVGLGLPYPALVERIGAVHALVPTPCDLVVDVTGVGKPVFDFLAPCNPVGVTITGGKVVEDHGGGLWSVPKAELARCVATALEGGLLKIARSLPHSHILASELQAFRVSISDQGHARFEGGGGSHDDLVLAVALALWRLMRDVEEK